ncbi:MAG: hypothetical protein ACI9NQ_001775 [Paracoccaceae bacterium]|jgi:hypothetical protein
MDSPQGQKQFECEHCQAAIVVPIDLPPTSAPCPVCQQVTTSPSLDQPIPRNQGGASDPAKNVSERNSGDLNYASYEEKKGGAGLLWSLAALTFLGLLVGGVVIFQKSKGVESSKNGNTEENISPSTPGGDPSFTGVEDQALAVLKNFLMARTIEEKAKYVIGKEATIPDMKVFYGSGSLPKEDLRADFFSEWPMDDSDTGRGIFLIEFDRPKQFRLGELFSPITDLKTHLTLKDPDLQTRSRAFRQNFEMEASRARVFLKKTGNELLIDWHTYVQTKDRLFRDFIEYPVAGRKGTFRLGISEDVSTILKGDPGSRSYRLTDPAHIEEDIAIVPVKRDSQVGKVLEKLAWTDIVGGRLTSLGVTVVLQWSSDATPVLVVSKVICWEFLGVGGDPSNL